MEKLPKDIIMKLALDLDIEDLISYCSTSPRINNWTCKKNIFWINKLKKDFNVDYLDSEVYKNLPKSPRLREIAIKKLPERKYYLELQKILDKEGSNIIIYGVGHDRLDIIKMGIYKDFPIFISKNLDPLSLALKLNNMPIFYYLLENGAINSKESSLSIILTFLKQADLNVKKQGKIDLILILYDDVLPRTYKYLHGKKNFWNQVVSKITQFKDEYPEFFTDLYNRRIEELTKLENP